MAASDSTVRGIVKVVGAHVDRETLVKIVRDLLGVSGSKSFRETVSKIARELEASRPGGLTG